MRTEDMHSDAVLCLGTYEMEFCKVAILDIAYFTDSKNLDNMKEKLQQPPDQL